ncbi:hypothetical protein B296_00028231 [Ensete ventricosum]|uniref:Uncharacterized protein n=1 Tax=Ensete ventricosum TaxID=4639 RepID=A0A426X154_ENSVE|nr:hypothetical protein B296_00028231 [Ensete ventricosum]
MPYPPSPSLRCRCPGTGGGYPLWPVVALPMGGHPCDRRHGPCWWQGWPQLAVHVGGCPLLAATPLGSRAL